MSSGNETGTAEQAAEFLVANRHADAALPDAFPAQLAPRHEGEARAIQLATLSRIGPIGGWKVGAASPTAEPACSPLPLSGIHPSGAASDSRLRYVEGEISFRFASALPPRERAYSAADVLAAIGTCQAAIEILDSRFADHEALDPLSAMADLHHHGGLIVGTPIRAWGFDMFHDLPVELSATGQPAFRAVGSNSAGTDLSRLLVWLANSETVRAAGGLLAGTWVTTGSWTGKIRVAPGGGAQVAFPGFVPVEVRFPA